MFNSACSTTHALIVALFERWDRHESHDTNIKSGGVDRPEFRALLVQIVSFGHRWWCDLGAICCWSHCMFPWNQRMFFVLWYRCIIRRARQRTRLLWCCLKDKIVTNQSIPTFSLEASTVPNFGVFLSTRCYLEINVDAIWNDLLVESLRNAESGMVRKSVHGQNL